MSESSGDESTPVASESASPTPSAPAKPERPEAMKRDDAEGAAAAAEYFLSLYAYTRSTGDTKDWDAMSHRACDFCKDGSNRAKEMAANGESLRGGGLEVEILQAYQRDDLTGIYPLDARVTQQAYETRDAGGDVTDSGEREVVDRRIEMGRRDGDWVVVTIAPIPGGEG
ncbi:DUF6318 family protein [Promicromonospora sp. NPDC057138]|uniref:DUF6318 family protein n=1 Tax=Promicromonospora sp. NPDC057138 TaxID=3346031 RepID=UPI00362B6B53